MNFTNEIRYELKIYVGSILFKQKYLAFNDARSIATSILYGDACRNSFNKNSIVNCRITQVNLTEAEVFSLTPNPVVKKRK